MYDWPFEGGVLQHIGRSDMRRHDSENNPITDGQIWSYRKEKIRYNQHKARMNRDDDVGALKASINALYNYKNNIKKKSSKKNRRNFSKVSRRINQLESMLWDLENPNGDIVKYGVKRPREVARYFRSKPFFDGIINKEVDDIDRLEKARDKLIKANKKQKFNNNPISRRIDDLDILIDTLRSSRNRLEYSQSWPITHRNISEHSWRLKGSYHPKRKRI